MIPAEWVDEEADEYLDEDDSESSNVNDADKGVPLQKIRTSNKLFIFVYNKYPSTLTDPRLVKYSTT
jgi:hypothetical protein